MNLIKGIKQKKRSRCLKPRFSEQIYRRSLLRMIPKLIDVLDVLEKVAPAQFAESWDNPGLQVGYYSQEVRKIFFALDPTLKALRSACKRKAQVLLTHHPLIFTPLSRIDISEYPGNVILEAAKSGVSVVAAHTNLDVARGGINDVLGNLLNLHNMEVLKEITGIDGVGLGRIGDLSEPVKLSDAEEFIMRILGNRNLKVVGQGNAEIHRVAVIGGSGGSLVSLASEKGADLLLTGDVSHHHALEAESLGIALIDGGHFYTEKVAFDIFAGDFESMIAAQGWQVTVEVDVDETNPIRDGAER